MKKTIVIFFLLLISIYAYSTTIYDIQYTTDPDNEGTYPSPMVDQIVTVTGIVTGANFGNDGKFFMSDPEGGAWHGIYVYDYEVGPALGDGVQVTATVTEYYGFTELGSCTINILSSGNYVPGPSPITANELSNPALAEKWEGCLVQIDNVTVTDAQNDYGEWYVEDQTGECQIDNGFFYLDEVQPEIVITSGMTWDRIIGCVDFSYDVNGIHPRFPEDLIEELNTNNLEDASIQASSNNVENGDDFEITISTSELLAEWNVISYQFNLTYNQDLINYESYSTYGTLSTDGIVSINSSNPGELIVGFMRTSPITGIGDLLKLNFQAIEEGETILDFGDFIYNATTITDLTNGYVTIEESGSDDLEDAIIVVSSANVNTGDNFEISITTSDLLSNWGVISYQFRFYFDAEMLTFSSSDLVGTLAENGSVSVNSSNFGELIIGFMTTTPLVGNGTILKLNFAADFAGESTLSIEDFLYNTTMITELISGFVTVGNEAPYVENPIEDLSFDEDTINTEIDLNSVFADDNSELSYTFAGNENISIDISEGNVTLTPISDWFGEEIISFIATDIYDAYTSDEVVITVENVNDSPIIVDFEPEPELIIDETSEVIFDMTAQDIDSEISYSWFIDSINQEISTETFTYLFNENGQYEVKCLISDQEYEIEQIWNVTVNIVSANNNPTLPTAANLNGNYPNPFNPSTTIKFAVASKERIIIDIYNAKGQKMITLYDGMKEAGYHSVEWNGQDKTGNVVSSGVYFCKASIGDKSFIHNMLLLK